MTRLTAKEGGGDVFLVSDLFCNLSSEEMCVGGVRDRGAVLDIPQFLFYKTKNNLRTAGAALWSRPRLTTIPLFDTPRRAQAPRMPARKAAPRQWDGLPLR